MPCGFRGLGLLEHQYCLDEDLGDSTCDGATVVVGFYGLFNVNEYYFQGWLMVTN